MDNITLKLKYYTRCMWLIILLLAVVNYLICYPGFLTIDSYVQFMQSKDLNLSNHHPALLSIIWHFMNFFYEGTQPMLVFSLALLWVSVFLLFESFKERYPRASLFLLIIPFTPALLSNTAIIWKDVFFAHATLLSLSLSIYCYFKGIKGYRRILFFISALSALFFGLSVKFQGQFIAPLVIMAMLYGIFKMPIKKTLFFTVIIVFLMWLSGVVTNTLFKVQNTHSEQLRQVFDLAGMSVCSNMDLLPQYIQDDSGYSFEKLKRFYTPVYVNTLFNPDLGGLKSTLDNENLQTLQRTFFRAVMEHPGCYLEHRFKNFFRLARSGAFVFTTCEDLTLDEKVVGAKLCDLQSTFYVKYVSMYIEYTKLLTRNMIFIVVNILGLLAFCLPLKAISNKENEDLYLTQYINAICIIFCLLAFLTTMASDNRYLYIVRVLTSAFLPIQAAVFYGYWKGRGNDGKG